MTRKKKKTNRGEDRSIRGLKMRDGNTVQLITGDRNQANQSVINKVPGRSENTWNAMLSSILGKLGVKATLWLLGVFGTLFTSYGGYKGYMLWVTLNPTTINNPFAPLGTWDYWLAGLFFVGIAMLFSFLYIVLNKGVRCKQCGRYFRIVEQGDGEIIEHGLNGQVKVKRTYSCYCAAKPWTVTAWEDHSPKRRL